MALEKRRVATHDLVLLFFYFVFCGRDKGSAILSLDSRGEGGGHPLSYSDLFLCYNFVSLRREALSLTRGVSVVVVLCLFLERQRGATLSLFLLGRQGAGPLWYSYWFSYYIIFSLYINALSIFRERLGVVIVCALLKRQSVTIISLDPRKTRGGHPLVIF